MRRYSTPGTLFSFALLFALVYTFSTSCRRNKDCDLIIHVQNGNTGGPVVGATVWVHPKASTGGNLTIQDQSSTTDNAGVATFTFELPALLDADISNVSPLSNPPPTACKLEEGKSVSKTIKVY